MKLFFISISPTWVIFIEAYRLLCEVLSTASYLGISFAILAFLALALF